MNEDVIFEAAAKSDSSSTDSGFASSIKRGGRKVLVVFRPLEDEDEDGLIDNESDSDYGSEDAVDEAIRCENWTRLPKEWNSVKASERGAFFCNNFFPRHDFTLHNIFCLSHEYYMTFFPLNVQNRMNVVRRFKGNSKRTKVSFKLNRKRSKRKSAVKIQPEPLLQQVSNIRTYQRQWETCMCVTRQSS